MRSGNPALNDNTFLDIGSGRVITGGDQAMTLNGTVNKTAILLMLVVFTAAYTWSLAAGPTPSPLVLPLMLGGLVGGLVFAIATIFKHTWAPITAPLYALCEGLFLGGVSAYYNAQYPGIVMQAVALTFGTLAALLMAYRSGLIKATENFKLGVVAATGAIFLVYLASWLMSLFGFGAMGFIHDSGPVGIGFSLVVVTIAALNLVLDFDFIESGVEAGAPKHMEWYGAFGLVVTLVWLYLEMLRLLSKLRD